MNEGINVNTGPEKPKELEELERISRGIVERALRQPTEKGNLIIIASTALQTGGILVLAEKDMFRSAMKKCLALENLDPKIKAKLEIEYEKLQIQEGL